MFLKLAVGAIPDIINGIHYLFPKGIQNSLLIQLVSNIDFQYLTVLGGILKNLSTGMAN